MKALRYEPFGDEANYIEGKPRNRGFLQVIEIIRPVEQSVIADLRNVRNHWSWLCSGAGTRFLDGYARNMSIRQEYDV
jgi:hypothetical protein